VAKNPAKKSVPGAKTGSPQALNFESSLAELENLVELMEAGDITLEESLQHFERGITLTRQCQVALKQAEQKVQILMKDNGDPEPFDEVNNDES
jgi:exodeoxyribonuclease VII small subunit